MERKGRVLVSMFFLLLLTSCSVISSEVRQQALSDVPLQVLIDKADEWRGQTVIVGGYIVEAYNDNGTGTLVLLQTPLSFAEEPLSKDDSEGRVLVRAKGDIDPEIYANGRRVTLAGVILGRVGPETKGCLATCLELGKRELHLWPEYRYVPQPYYVPYYWRDDFYDDRYYYYPPYPYYYPGYFNLYWQAYPR